MRGIIISFDKNSGLISGEDGNRYQFSITDWSFNAVPFLGMKVDFIEENNTAKSIFPLSRASKHSKVTLALVCFFVGSLGIHRFMVGKIWTGILMLVLTCSLFGAVITTIWVIIDLILILSDSFKDKDGNIIQRADI